MKCGALPSPSRLPCTAPPPPFSTRHRRRPLSHILTPLHNSINQSIVAHPPLLSPRPPTPPRHRLQTWDQAKARAYEQWRAGKGTAGEASAIASGAVESRVAAAGGEAGRAMGRRPHHCCTLRCMPVLLCPMEQMTSWCLPPSTSYPSRCKLMTVPAVAESLGCPPPVASPILAATARSQDLINPPPRPLPCHRPPTVRPPGGSPGCAPPGGAGIAPRWVPPRMAPRSIQGARAAGPRHKAGHRPPAPLPLAFLPTPRGLAPCARCSLAPAPSPLRCPSLWCASCRRPPRRAGNLPMLRCNNSMIRQQRAPPSPCPGLHPGELGLRQARGPQVGGAGLASTTRSARGREGAAAAAARAAPPPLFNLP